MPMLIRLCDQMAGEQPVAGRTELGSPCVQRVLTGEAEGQKVLQAAKEVRGRVTLLLREPMDCGVCLCVHMHTCVCT